MFNVKASHESYKQDKILNKWWITFDTITIRQSNNSQLRFRTLESVINITYKVTIT